MNGTRPSPSDSILQAMNTIKARWPTMAKETATLFLDVLRESPTLAVEACRSFVRACSHPDLHKLVEILAGLRERARYEAETAAFTALPSAPVVRGAEASRRLAEIRSILSAPKPEPHEYPPRIGLSARLGEETFASKFGHWTPEKTAARKSALVAAALAAWGKGDE